MKTKYKCRCMNCGKVDYRTAQGKKLIINGKCKFCGGFMLPIREGK